MSEEMKLLLALIKHLNLEARCSGQGVTNKPVDADIFKVDNPEYTYTIEDKA